MQKLAKERLKKLSSMKKFKGPHSVKISDVKTGEWRTNRPVIDHGKCTMCGVCVEYCPCGVMEKLDQIIIDYDYCKGCGICVVECPVKAIDFLEEIEEEEEGE